MYLEFFIAGLTGFFLWLFLHHIRAFNRERTRQLAGPLLLKVKPTWFEIALTFILLSLLVLFIFWGFKLHISATLVRPWDAPEGIDVQIIPFYWIDFDCFLGAFLFFSYLSIISFYRWNYIEIHENGVVMRSLTGAQLIRYEKIRYFRWITPKKTDLHISLVRLFVPYRWFTVREPELVEPILSRFVEVLDNTGKVIAAPVEGRVPYKPGRSSKRRFADLFAWQFDIKTIFLLMLLVASASSWYGYHSVRFKPQRDAIAKLAEFQPSVGCYDADVQILWFFNLQNRLPEDDDLIAVKSLPNIKSFGLKDPKITDEGLAHLSSATKLRHLGLVDTSITGTGLAYLKNLLQLRSLSLYESPITDANLSHLEVFPLLERLNLGKTKITDAGLSHLSALTQLTDLELEGTNITDAGLVHLKNLSQLESLRLSLTSITDAGLESLQSMPLLNWLDLSKTKITDVGLMHLKSLSQLESLRLDGTQISDAGLPSLYGLKKLTWVELTSTNVTPDGIALLKQALRKDATIDFTPPAPPTPPTSMAESLEDTEPSVKNDKDAKP
jgi:hypothetical protein